MRTKGILGLLMCIALVFSLSFAQPANAASDEEEVLQVATNFIKAFNTCDFNLVSSLYWHSSKTSEYNPNAGYPFLFQGWEGIEKWFKSTFEYPVGAAVLSLHNPQVVVLDNNVAIITVYTNVILNPPVVEEQSISQNRESFVVQKIDGKWLIVHHHASALPTE